MFTVILISAISVAVIMYFSLFAVIVSFKQEVAAQARKEGQRVNQEIADLNKNLPESKKEQIYHDWYAKEMHL